MKCLPVILLGTASITATLRAGEWRNVTADDGLPGNEVQMLKAAKDGGVWVGTLSGLALHRDGKIMLLTKEGILVNAGEGAVWRTSMWDITPAEENSYWLGTGNGVHLVGGGKNKTFLRGTTVAPIVRGGGRTFYAISKDLRTESNVLVFTDGTDWQPVPEFKGVSVVDLTRGPDGTIRVVEDANGVHAFAAATGPARRAHDLSGRNVTALLQDSQHRVWCGTWGQGLFVKDGDNAWQRHLEKEKSAILGLAESTDGAVWVATSANGLWHFDGRDWRSMLSDEGGINLLQATSDGKVWISSQAQGGLRYWDGTAWQTSLTNPLPIRCLLETPDKRLVAGGVLDGLHVLSP